MPMANHTPSCSRDELTVQHSCSFSSLIVGCTLFKKEVLDTRCMLPWPPAYQCESPVLLLCALCYCDLHCRCHLGTYLLPVRWCVAAPPGSAFLAADTYGCHVHGLDLSVNAILVAIERAAAAGSRSKSSCGSGAASPANDAHANGTNGVHNGEQCQGSPERQQQVPHDVTFEVADMLTREFPEGCFDVCISRDSLLHVEDKQALFAK